MRTMEKIVIVLIILLVALNEEDGDFWFDNNDDHLEYEEDGDGDEGLVAVLLLGDEGQGEVGVDRK